MELDLSSIPFSRFGSYLAFSLLAEDDSHPAGLYLRSVRGPATGGRPMQEILQMQLIINNQPLDFTTHATFTCLSLTALAGRADLCLPSANIVHIRLSDAGLRFHMPAGDYDNIIPGSEQTWQLTVNTIVETKLQFTPLKGHIEIDAPWQAEHSEYITITLCPDSDGAGEFSIEEAAINWPGSATALSFEESQRRVDAELNAFIAALPQVPVQYADSRQLAGYTLWSCAVAPQGHLTRPSIFASKNGMIGIWSWDHCFHSLALADGHPDLAWAQFMAIFDQQDQSGALPDLVNDRLLSWSFCKPPVHGWILLRLLHTSSLLTIERLHEIYPQLERWTNWWFNFRDSDADGIPQCNHGNDGGWDNSTVFAVRPPVESPEISAYLVLQMDFMAQAAARLGSFSQAAAWTARADALTTRLMDHFWRANHFVGVQVGTHTDIESQSLLLYLPLLLAKRLPLAVRESLIARLKTPGEFLTSFGLATENLKSPLYRSKGYWRGPIWPAPMLIIIDALMACGEIEFASELRRRFCDLVNGSGMAENFDAHTGQGYHDFHFSWTASIFLTLAHEL